MVGELMALMRRFIARCRSAGLPDGEPLPCFCTD